MIKAGKQQTTLSDKGDYPKAQVKGLGQINNIRHFTPYGFYCSPPLNSTWVIFPLRNNPDDLIGIGQDFVNRFKNLLTGEVALANTVTGAYIKLDASGNIEIFSTKEVKVNCKDASLTAETLTVTCPDTTWTGDITLTGDIIQTGSITATVDVTGGGISLKTHTHSGVTTGAENTGVPN